MARPRSVEARSKVLAAAGDLMAERGVAMLTIDEVAQRSGVAKTTIYRHWPERTGLIVDAVNAGLLHIGTPDTGSLRGDLELLAQDFFHFYLDTTGWATLRIVIDAAGSPQPLGRFAEAVTDLHRDTMEMVGKRAVARGDAPDDDELEQLWNCLYGSLLMQVLNLRTRHRELDDEQIVERSRALVGFVLAALTT